ncbi:MAG TPA: hypothetical protein VFI91_05765 [Longimicrobiaceae bacterium]|nr:hypothetical protein [Longimicrobiaceae bacterium]
MHRKLMKLLTIPAVLLISVGLWGCNDSTDPISPLLRGAEESTILFSVVGQSYRVIKDGTSSYEKVSFVIGPDDSGDLHIGSHTLSVPEGAVTEPTVFTMVKPYGKDLEFSLSATRTDSTGAVIDVGARGFHAPVTLTASFEKVSMNLDRSLVIAWLRPDGLIEVQETRIDTASKAASADLWHFSEYVIATPF